MRTSCVGSISSGKCAVLMRLSHVLCLRVASLQGSCAHDIILRECKHVDTKLSVELGHVQLEFEVIAV